MDWNYKGTAITILESGRFQIGESDGHQWCDTFAQAQKEIDSQLAVEAKVRHANVALPVLDSAGNKHVIKGINRSDGSALGIPKRTYGLFYPTDAIKALLQEKERLDDRVAEISTLLKSVEVKQQYGYGRVEVHDYDERMQRLQDGYEAAAKASETVTA